MGIFNFFQAMCGVYMLLNKQKLKAFELCVVMLSLMLCGYYRWEHRLWTATSF